MISWPKNPTRFVDAFFSFLFFFFLLNGSCISFKRLPSEKSWQTATHPPTHPLMDVRLFGIAIPLVFWPIFIKKGDWDLAYRCMYSCMYTHVCIHLNRRAWCQVSRMYVYRYMCIHTSQTPFRGAWCQVSRGSRGGRQATCLCRYKPSKQN